jgi:hypothetical protein
MGLYVISSGHSFAAFSPQFPAKPPPYAALVRRSEVRPGRQKIKKQLPEEIAAFYIR